MLTKTCVDIIKEAALNEDYHVSDMISEEIKSYYNSCVKDMPTISKNIVSYDCAMIPVFQNESSYFVEMDNVVKYMTSCNVRDIKEAMNNIANENRISLSDLSLVVESKKYMNSIMESAAAMSKAGDKTLLEDCELSIRLLNMLKQEGINVVLTK